MLESPTPPPPMTLIRATWSSFLCQNRRFAHTNRKKVDADNEGCNDNYDDTYGNFDDSYDKMTEKKHIQLL